MDGGVLFGTYLLEALFLGIIGSVAGVGVGHILALGAVGMLSETVNALYFATSVEALSITSTDILIGIGLGVVFSLFGRLDPSKRCHQTPPAQILARGDWSPGFHWLRNPRMGLMLLFPGSTCFTLSKHGVGGRFEIAGRWIRDRGLLDTWGGSAIRASPRFSGRLFSSPLFRCCLPLGMQSLV